MLVTQWGWRVLKEHKGTLGTKLPPCTLNQERTEHLWLLNNIVLDRSQGAQDSLSVAPLKAWESKEGNFPAIIGPSLQASSGFGGWVISLFLRITSSPYITPTLYLGYSFPSKKHGTPAVTPSIPERSLHFCFFAGSRAALIYFHLFPTSSPSASYWRIAFCF